ncbi:hypothetical protein EON79_22065, partial [bacterium]
MVHERLTLTGDVLDRNLLSQVLDRLNEHRVGFRLPKFDDGGRVGKLSHRELPQAEAHPMLVQPVEHLAQEVPIQDIARKSQPLMNHGESLARGRT